jgi:glutamate racemase
LYASVVERFAREVRLLQHTCPGLVEQIEAGNLDGGEPRRILVDALQPMLAQGIDTVVLGCTHYPFVIPLIQELAGAGVRVIDPAPAVARQVGRLLDQHGLRAPAYHIPPILRLITSGDPAQLAALLPGLLGEVLPVEAAVWEDGSLS